VAGACHDVPRVPPRARRFRRAHPVWRGSGVCLFLGLFSWCCHLCPPLDRCIPSPHTPPPLPLSFCSLQLDQLPMMVAKVHSPDPNVQLEGTQEFRKLLSIGGYPRAPISLRLVFPTPAPPWVPLLARVQSVTPLCMFVLVVLCVKGHFGCGWWVGCSVWAFGCTVPGPFAPAMPCGPACPPILQHPASPPAPLFDTLCSASHVHKVDHVSDACVLWGCA
jgi:hypothetical protein